jgi:uncharacterized protein
MPTKKKSEEEKTESKETSGDIPAPSPAFDKAQGPNGKDTKDNNPDDEMMETHKPIEAPEKQKQSSPATPLNPLPAHEARTWAMLVHLSILLNMVSGFLGMVAALIIYFVYKDRSRFVAYHAMQSFIFQAITWIGVVLVASMLITFGGVFAFLIIPLLCLFGGLLLLLVMPASLIYGIIGAVKVNNGEDFRYWQVGDWVRDILEPKGY